MFHVEQPSAVVYKRIFDVIVVGAGHAGCEAALISAKMGCNTLLLTISVDKIAQMSCNPAIGGLAKGHLVKELDILGGQMAENIDQTGLQFKILNKSKGPAVWSSRAQADMDAYRLRMKKIIENQENLLTRQEMADELIVEDGHICGIVTNIGNFYQTKAVVLTPGTFMKGTIWIGMNKYSAGRAWEMPSQKLSDSLRKIGFAVGRLKTGTTPRLDARTIDFSKLEADWGDNPPVPFSFRINKIDRPIRPCYIAHTNKNVHDIIRKNLDRSPLYSGKITSIGPRYCPSIEDKVVKFPDRDSHHVFLEPQTAESTEIYPDGLSTSLPYDVQLAYLRAIRGLEDVEIIRPGYAVEYDFVPPTQLYPTFETKLVKGLFNAGQINGTSGYEEAAAQGIYAGINAACFVQKRSPLILNRNEAYLGVMVDDLVTKGTKEPYRMFTSRAEYRLMLREDNADIRLAQKAFDLGLMPKERYDEIMDREHRLAEHIKTIKKSYVVPSKINRLLQKQNISPVSDKTPMDKLLRRPQIDIKLFRKIYKTDCSDDELLRILYRIKYEPFIKKEQREIEKFTKSEKLKIPEDFSYERCSSLSIEVREKLNEIRPVTLGQASRIPGITPAAISILMIYIKRYRMLHKATEK